MQGRKSRQDLALRTHYQSRPNSPQNQHYIRQNLIESTFVPLSGKLPVVTPTTSQLYYSAWLNASYLATSNHFNFRDLIMSHMCHHQQGHLMLCQIDSLYWEPSHSCPELPASLHITTHRHQVMRGHFNFVSRVVHNGKNHHTSVLPITVVHGTDEKL